MEQFIMNGTMPRSLEELRENFNLKDLTEAYLRGTLQQWLEECYYEREAEAINDLDDCDLPSNLSEVLCEILGVDYMAYVEFSPEQLAELERKKDALRRYTEDVEVLSHASETALDQVDLAGLLNHGKKEIYLCEGSFAVPIKKSGVHYIGIGQPKVTTSFTEEQYRRAGITFRDVDLPKEPSEIVQEAAEEAATQNGYDDFAENHTKLAILIHERINREPCIAFCRLAVDASEVACKSYKSKATATSEGRAVVDLAYDQANAFFDVSNSKNLARKLAEDYAGRFSRVRKLGRRLGETLPKTKRHYQSFESLRKLVNNSESALHQAFEEELSDNADFYQMYKRSYFHGQITVEKCGCDIDIFDSAFLNGLHRLLQDDTEYIVRNLFETIQELDADVQKHAAAFCAEAYKLFLRYCEEIEAAAEQLGLIVPDHWLTQVGIDEEKLED